jgi:hypothetical protein
MKALMLSPAIQHTEAESRERDEAGARNGQLLLTFLWSR